MKKRMLLIMLVAMMMLSMVACSNGNKDSETTTAGNSEVTTTPAPATTTVAPSTTKAPETTKAPDTQPPVTTEEETLPPAKGDTISETELSILKLKMPASLPDGTVYDIYTRAMCGDYGDEDYSISGNSKGSTKFISEDEGAVYGKAFQFAGKADSAESRGEIQIDLINPFMVNGAKGIMFYVDTTHLIPKEDATMMASVTINVNKIRSKGTGETGSAIGYYYLDGAWVQTTNGNACRMKLPTSFKGWVYVPATSFTQSTDGEYWDSATGCFNDMFFVENMRCYTEGYTYSADSYIIFDEITFIK